MSEITISRLRARCLARRLTPALARRRRGLDLHATPRGLRSLREENSIAYTAIFSMFSGRKVKWNHFGKKYALRISDYELDYADLYDVSYETNI